MELIPGLPDDIARHCLIHLPYHHFPTAQSVCTRWKHFIESPHFHIQRKSTGLSRTLLVLTQADPVQPAGPAKTRAAPVYGLTVHEPETGSWNRLPPVPDHPNGLPLFCECAGVGRKLVVIGGWNTVTWEVSRSVHVYDFISATWTRGADMPGPSRSFFACASDSDRTVYVAGGHDEEKNALRSALAYDVTNNTWSFLADMESPRDECKGVFRGGKFCAIGGYRTEMQGRFESSAEAYDGETWHSGGEVLEAGVCPRTVAVAVDGKMYRCRREHLAVMDVAGEWGPAAELPEDVIVGSFLVMWRNMVMVSGSAGYDKPYNAYVAEKEKSGKYMWRKEESPIEFTGHIQAGCIIEV